MAAHDVLSLVAVSAAGAFDRKAPELGMGFRAMMATVLKPVYDDMERMEQRIAASGASWTIVRPVGLTEDPATGHYRLSLDGSLLPKASRVSRADVAALVPQGAGDRLVRPHDTGDRRLDGAARQPPHSNGDAPTISALTSHRRRRTCGSRVLGDACAWRLSTK